jgi:hypothetical protein
MATDFIFRYVEKYSSQAKCNRKCRKYSDKDILACVLFLQAHRTRDLKLHGINYSTVYERILRWNKQSVLQSALRDMQLDFSVECLQQDKFHFKNIIIDASFIKNVQGRDCLGRNSTDRGRNATKISAITDKSGMPLAYSIHPGNCSDFKAANDTIEKVSCFLKSDNRVKTNLLGDKAYACVKGNAFRKKARNLGYRLVVHPKSNYVDKFISVNDKRLLKHIRCNVEHCFGRMKSSAPKRLWLRYDHKVEMLEVSLISLDNTIS